MFADGWLNLNALVFFSFPKDHLLGVEVAMRELGCGESMALAGLFHSVYGTEGFQFYTLPLSERPKVRELIG